MGCIGYLEDVVREWLQGARKVVIVGIGNELRRDDFVGVKVVRELKGQVPKQVMLVESETVPESFIRPIVSFHPSHVLLIDAGLLGMEAGEAKFLEPSSAWKQPIAAVSTHALPLRIFCELLKEEAGAKVGLLVIQPERTDFGEGLSVKAVQSSGRLKRMLLNVLRALPQLDAVSR